MINHYVSIHRVDGKRLILALGERRGGMRVADSDTELSELELEKHH